ncbi:unnamed protein product [Vitrella brassicaformis CCMP3155]|uniref:Uncharacterized protein n=3 Tax=Vitrella brassicaformis TaxID=1169539 RepID=A0A0G4GEM6_VITBC|nr:unnamed protein product [Vitrella brassicaformis CCMP3155]|mmetsp:Transcript_16965/g.40700  ORF Transcript_16965/g.40700 Transcript_16965/m.40700 type:complete len:285 (+) Transcript_16965:47-901(+)|eukprot:CEM27840.1 unnamed protein product [Vitrella brassicaformis CCMP3155]
MRTRKADYLADDELVGQFLAKYFGRSKYFGIVVHKESVLDKSNREVEAYLVVYTDAETEHLSGKSIREKIAHVSDDDVAMQLNNLRLDLRSKGIDLAHSLEEGPPKDTAAASAKADPGSGRRGKRQRGAASAAAAAAGAGASEGDHEGIAEEGEDVDSAGEEADDTMGAAAASATAAAAGGEEAQPKKKRRKHAPQPHAKSLSAASAGDERVVELNDILIGGDLQPLSGDWTVERLKGIPRDDFKLMLQKSAAVPLVGQQLEAVLLCYVRLQEMANAAAGGPTG